MKLWHLYPLVLGLATICCDSESDDNKADDAFPATGGVTKISSTLQTLTFTDGVAGAKYFIMPFSLGATSGTKAVNGGGGQPNNSFSVKVQGSSLVGFVEPKSEESSAEPTMTGRAFDHALRTLLNRFDPNDEASWQRAEELEQVVVSDGPYQNDSFKFASQPRGIVSALENMSASFARRAELPQSSQLLGVCPGVDTLTVFDPTGNGDLMASSDVSLSAESADFCLYVHKTKGLVTETNAETIKAGIAASLATYKTIYGTTFSQTKDKYKFQPLIIVLPYGDNIYWPDPKGALKVSAAFIGEASLTHNRPTIYVAADQSKVGQETDKAKLNELFHSSIAHEMQHAILHFYRLINGVTIDTTQVDEGIAHFMEDLNGFGEVNFPLFPGAFLNTFASGINPIFPDITKGTGSSTERGAAHAFIYYLVSQKGGVSFSSGRPNAGGGLDFIKTFVTGKKSNIDGLAAAYGTDWVEAMGGYLGALAIDGATTVKETSAFKTQIPEKDITNTIGKDSKTYGMRFHAHGGVADLKETLDNFSKLTATVDVKVSEYQTTPLLLELKDPADKVTITLQQAFTNAGVTVVRFK